MKKILAALVLAALPFSAHAATKGKTKAPQEPKSVTYQVDTKASVAEWEGRKLVGAHHGKLKFKSGALTVKNGILQSGDVVIDMTSLVDEDLTDAELNTKLVNHLKSDDFFSVEKNPTASLKVTKVSQQGDKATVTGDLTIKGITKPVTFPLEFKAENGHVKASGEMKVDRTMFDIKFRSLKYFSSIGDKVIYDDFKVKVDLSASK